MSKIIDYAPEQTTFLMRYSYAIGRLWHDVVCNGCIVAKQ